MHHVEVELLWELGMSLLSGGGCTMSHKKLWDLPLHTQSWNSPGIGAQSSVDHQDEDAHFSPQEWPSLFLLEL
jgi:hypothetical protein